MDQKKRKQNRFFYILQRFVALNQKFKGAFVCTLFFLTINQALSAVMNLLIGALTDDITAADYVVFGRKIIFVIGIEIVHLLVSYQVSFRIQMLSEGFVKNLRVYTYRQITNASMRWLDEHKIGDIISRVNGDLNALVQAITNFLTWQLTGIMVFIVYIAACFFINVKLSLMSFCLVPIIAFLQFQTGKPIAKLGEKRSVAEGKSNSILIDLLGGLSMIRSFCGERKMFENYDAQVQKTVRANVKSFSLEFIMYPLQVLMSYLPVLIIAFFGSRMVVNDEMTIGALLSFILLATGALDTIGSLSWMVRTTYDTVGIANRILEIWDVELEPEGGQIVEKKLAIPISFSKVCFYYKETEPVLEEITFQVKQGEKIALVGASGSGKTTIVKLLAGFYEKIEGEIHIFGGELSNWNRQKLRSFITYVGQDAFLFPGSIYSNIAIGNEKASREKILECIKVMGLDSLDIDMPIGERGVLLSGGQKQRITIARALMKESEILIMDEPTSALDAESEQYVTQAIEQFAGNRICIVIAHRLATISHMDRILCLEQGHIVEEGNHKELMKQNGVYRSLYEKQQGGAVYEA